MAVVSRIRIGPARMPSRESPEEAVEILLARGYSACEIDFESGFWMDYPFAERLGELAREHDIALSVHAPLFGFMGHLEAAGASSRLPSAPSTAAPGSRQRAAPSSSSSIPASCSDGLARTRSTRSSSSSARCASGSKARGERCRSASR